MKKRNSKALAGEIEEVMGSKGRLRVLKFLVRNPKGEPALSVFRLKMLTGLRGRNVEKHLETLVEWGWVEEIPTLGGRKYRLKRENPRVEALIKFFKKADYV